VSPQSRVVKRGPTCPFRLQVLLAASGLRTPRLGRGKGVSWRRWIDTFQEAPEDIVPWQEAPTIPGCTYRVGPRSVVVLWASVGDGPASSSKDSRHNGGRERNVNERCNGFPISPRIQSMDLTLLQIGSYRHPVMSTPIKNSVDIPCTSGLLHLVRNLLSGFPTDYRECLPPHRICPCNIPRGGFSILESSENNPSHFFLKILVFLASCLIICSLLWTTLQ